MHLGDGGAGGFSGEQSKDDLDFQWYKTLCLSVRSLVLIFIQMHELKDDQATAGNICVKPWNYIQNNFVWA